MNIAVIGGSGFVGTELISILQREHAILNLDKKLSQHFEHITRIVDVRNKDQLNESLQGQDIVVLLAAEHRDDVSPASLYYDVNVEGTIRVLQMMDRFNIKKLIFTSSVAVYGLNKNFPNEKSKLDPFNHYGKSKFQAEKEIFKWYEKDKKGKKIS